MFAATVAALLLAGCPSERAGTPAPSVAPVVVATRTTPPPPTTTAPPTRPPATTEIVDIPLRIETYDASFAYFALATLNDPRGWPRAGFRFRSVADGPFRLVLADGGTVDALCLPLTTYGTYSCQNGPVVALNQDRWATATPKWTGTPDDYRRYLVNHEVGHLLGMRHPATQCPGRGRAAPIMNQQSTELDGCRPNPWPLDHEIALASKRPPNLAPPPDP